MQRLPAITHARFSLIRFRSPLLTESRLLSLPVGNEMFHFPTFPPHTLCVQVRVTGHDSCRVPPFGNPRITARLTAPRGLSQPPTSFIGSWCQGIHRSPLTTYPQKTRCSRPLCNSQPTTNPQPDQSPTRTPGTQHPQAPAHLKRYGQPGHAWTVLKDNRGPKAATVVLSGPNRVLSAFSQPHQDSVPTTRRQLY